MAPPDASSGNRIPSLSWDSVVDDTPAAPAPDAADEPKPEPPVDVAPVTPVVEPLTFESSALEPAASEPISFAPMELSTTPAPAPAPTPSAPAIDLSIPPLGSTIPLLGDVDAVESTTETTASPPAEPPASTAASGRPVPTAAPAASPAASPAPPSEAPPAAPAPRPDASTERPDPRPSGRTSITPSGRTSITPSGRTSITPSATPVDAPADPPQSTPSPTAAPEHAAPAVAASAVAAHARAQPTSTSSPEPAGDPADTASTSDTATTPAAEDAAASSAPDGALPPIQEATPVPPSAPTPTAPASSPALPQVAAAIPVPTSAPARAAAPVPQPTTTRQRPRRGLTLLLTIVVLGAVVAAAVVYGPRYLFPDDWDAAAKPYADTVEEVRGVEFAAPVAVVSEPAGAFTARSAAELTGDWTEQQPEWRALGILSGAVTESTIAELLSGWTSADYSTVDGQIYHDAALTGDALDSSLTEAMAAASLDQDYGWSPEQVDRSLDDAALVDAEVTRQSRAVREASDFPTPIAESSPQSLLALPPLLGYEALAPAVFAEFALVSESGDPLDVTGPGGPLGSEPVALAPGPVMIGNDKVLTSPRLEDRSFWFLVFAAYLDSRVAYETSEAIVENALTIAQRTATQCAYATFAGGDVDQTARVRTSLEQWVAAAPAELSASFSVLPDGTLQLSSCDPGPGFEQPVRSGTMLELISWRSAELATSEGVRAGGGGAAEFQQAWPVVEASPAALDVGAASLESLPSEIAEAARSAVTAVFFPPG